MRLPFLQVTNEVMDQAAPDLAILLGWSEGDAFLGLCRLFRWALGRCPTDSPPSANATINGASAGRLIANAARWAGDPDIFVAACDDVRPALLEQMEDGSVRIRGLDRYDAAWARSFPDEAKAWKQGLRGNCAEVAQDLSKSSAEVGHQTKTQTHTQIEEKNYVVEESDEAVSTETPPAPIRIASQPPEPQGITVEPPETPTGEWTGADFWRWAQGLRQEGGLLAERAPNPRKISAWFTSCLMTEGVTADALCRGFEEYGQDPFWESKGFPFAGFMSQWAKYTRPEVADGAAA